MDTGVGTMRTLTDAENHPAKLLAVGVLSFMGRGKR
jgi:hypothetical protein